MKAFGLPAVSVFLVFAGFASTLHAQAYPSKPIRLIVPFAPGGSSEFVARTASAEMAKGLGQSFVVENKPGGGGNVAMQEVARAEPDGYTLIIGHIGSLAMNPFIYAKLPYDANRDFTPISLLVKIPTLFVVHADVPAKNLREFVALAKREPGKVNYGTAGNGSAGHMAIEYLKLVTGMDIQHVPYKGTGPMLVDLVAGRTQASAAGTPPLLPHIQSGKLRAIAVGTPDRLSVLPEVGTVAEQGYPGFETAQWYGLNAPAKTPEAIVRRLSEEAAKAMKSPAMVERLAVESAISVGSTPQEYAQFIAREQARWKEVIQKAHIKAD
jgi:tripartite-type tricarboxylate transporter receptor subunit TctC